MLEHQTKALALVATLMSHKNDLDEATSFEPDMFRITGFTYTLGNWKALVSSPVIPGTYWEVTYNATKKETYVDQYRKVSNTCISDEELEDNGS